MPASVCRRTSPVAWMIAVVLAAPRQRGGSHGGGRRGSVWPPPRRHGAARSSSPPPWGSPGPAPGVGGTHGASAKHNAHKTEIHRVHYMWHPLFGCDVVVHFRAIRPTGVTFRCQVDQDDKRRRSEVPAWMFDRAVCSQIQLLPEPHVTLRALVELKWLLDSAARRQECQDRPPAELGGADESNPTKTPHVASTGSIRPTGPDTEVERPRTGRPSDGHKTGGIAVAGTLGTRGRPLPERGRR